MGAVILATTRKRLDTELVRRRLVPSRAAAAEAIQQGLVTVDGAPARKSSTMVTVQANLAVLATTRRFVSRGGDKLDHGLDVFDVDVEGRWGIDAGASTGGFTDCLLQRGAAGVIAFDVGYGQLHDRLRRDPRVIVRERTNIRHVTKADLGDQAYDLLVADLSFISLAMLLPGLLGLLATGIRCDAVVLVKPQFEAERSSIGSGGVVRDPAVWRQSVRRVAEAARHEDWNVRAATVSPLLGPAGNVEFLLHIANHLPATRCDGHEVTEESLDELIDHAQLLQTGGAQGNLDA